MSGSSSQGSLLPSWVRVVRSKPAAYERRAFAKVQIRSAGDAVALLKPTLQREEQEIFVAVSLNTQHYVLGLTRVTQGLVNSSLVHPREVFRVAIAMNATALLVAHNHPSGDPTPSADDMAVTDQLVAAGHMLGIPVYDHIIIAGERFTSFANEGLL